MHSVDDLEIQGTLTEHYVALRAYEKFLTEFGNIPGECYAENDTLRLKSVASKMISDWGAHTSISDDMIHEICRYGGSEIHSISAFIGKLTLLYHRPNFKLFQKSTKTVSIL